MRVSITVAVIDTPGEFFDVPRYCLKKTSSHTSTDLPRTTAKAASGELGLVAFGRQ